MRAATRESMNTIVGEDPDFPQQAAPDHLYPDLKGEGPPAWPNINRRSRVSFV